LPTEKIRNIKKLNEASPEEKNLTMNRLHRVAGDKSGEILENMIESGKKYLMEKRKPEPEKGKNVSAKARYANEYARRR